MEKYNTYPQPWKRAAIDATSRAGFGKVNTAHPGQNMGLTLDQVRDLVENGVKAMGVSFVTAAGSVTPNIQLPATAKYIVGFAFSNQNIPTDDVFTLLINEEQTHQNAGAWNYTIKFGGDNEAYFRFFRPVAGSTSVQMNYTSVAGGNANVLTIFYV